jgi:UDP-glucose 4-epimerase
MRILLTGGLGYLGGRLARALAAEPGYELTLTTRRAALPQLPFRAAIQPLDWSRDAELERLCDGHDAIVHLAGMNAADSARSPVEALQFNGVDTARLVRAAAHRKVRRFIYLSTAHVYGSMLRGRVDESTATAPRHPYGSSHRAGEDAVRLTALEGGMERVVVRLSNVFGAPSDPQVDCWSLVTNDLCRQAATQHRAILSSRGNQRRDFLPMSEACRALAHLLTMAPAHLGDGVLNVGGQWAPSVFELAQVIRERVAIVLGLEVQIVRGSREDSVGGEQLEYSIAKLLTTGFVPNSGATSKELDELIRFCAEHAPALAT